MKSMIGIKMDQLQKTLKDAGFNEQERKEFLEYKEKQNWKGQCECLTEKRQKLLAQVHEKEQQITCLDYLKYKLEKERR